MTGKKGDEKRKSQAFVVGVLPSSSSLGTLVCLIYSMGLMESTSDGCDSPRGYKSNGNGTAGLRM